MSLIHIIGVDLETTGLHQDKGDRIVEIAMMEMRYEAGTGRGWFGRKFVQRVNPMRPIDPAAEAVHGISMNMLRDEPIWESVAPAVAEFLKESKLLVAHNMQFDGPFLGGELLRAGAQLPKAETFCTMQAARWATPMGKLPKLSELCFSLGVKYDHAQAHAAEYDVKQTLKCLWRGLKGGYYALPRGLHD